MWQKMLQMGSNAESGDVYELVDNFISSTNSQTTRACESGKDYVVICCKSKSNYYPNIVHSSVSNLKLLLADSTWKDITSTGTSAITGELCANGTAAIRVYKFKSTGTTFSYNATATGANFLVYEKIS